MKYIHKQNSKSIKKIIELIIGLYLIYLLTFSLFNKNTISEFYLEITSLWLTKVIPSIGTIYIISSFIVNYPILSYFLYPLLKSSMNFENQKSCSLFLISIIAGQPTIAALIKKSIENEEISIEEGNRLMGFTSHLSPLFLLFILNKKLAVCTIIIQIIASIIIASIFKTNGAIHSNRNKQTIDIIYFDIVSFLPKILLNVLASMIIVNLIKKSIINLISSQIIITLSSFFEISTGLYYLSIINFPVIFQLLIINLLVSSTGLAIILQVYWITKNTPLSFKHYLSKRLLHMLICSIETGVFYLISLFFKFI